MSTMMNALLSLVITLVLAPMTCLSQNPTTIPNAIGVSLTGYTSPTCDPSTYAGTTFIPGPFTQSDDCTPIKDGSVAGYSLTCITENGMTDYSYTLWAPKGCPVSGSSSSSSPIVDHVLSSGATGACVPFTLTSNGVVYAPTYGYITCNTQIDATQPAVTVDSSDVHLSQWTYIGDRNNQLAFSQAKQTLRAQ